MKTIPIEHLTSVWQRTRREETAMNQARRGTEEVTRTNK
jgi:hypothetical protein